MMLGNYIVFDFGESFFRDERVVDLVIDKMPVSISLGIWTTLLVYLISVPLGIVKAVRDGSRFDIWTSGVVIVDFTKSHATVRWLKRTIGQIIQPPFSISSATYGSR